jgi:membrane protein YqaA with SNARE-associated domain
MGKNQSVQSAPRRKQRIEHLSSCSQEGTVTGDKSRCGFILLRLNPSAKPGFLYSYIVRGAMTVGVGDNRVGTGSKHPKDNLLVAHLCGQAGELHSVRTSDALLLLSMALLAVYGTVTIFLPESTGFLLLVYDWLLQISIALGYPGDFLVPLVGNAIVIVPFPYEGIPFILGGIRNPATLDFVFDPTLVGLIAGLGAMIGEMVCYLAGRLGGRLVDEKQTSGFSAFVKRHSIAAPLAVFIVAATPIPDDAVIIPLGAVKYPWWKVVPPLLAGKTVELTAIAWAGRLSLDWIARLLGAIESAGMLGTITEVAAMALVVLCLYLVARIDWTRF